MTQIVKTDLSGIGDRMADTRARHEVQRMLTDEHWTTVFLREYAQVGSMAIAARHAGVVYETVRLRRKSDPEFAQAVEEAHEEFVGRLKAEAVRRAVDGWEVPVYYKSDQVGVRREYSDALLMYLLKRHDPSAADVGEGTAVVKRSIQVTEVRVEKMPGRETELIDDDDKGDVIEGESRDVD